MLNAAMADVILFSSRAELVKPASEHLKMKGVTNIVAPFDASAAIESLDRYRRALLIIDWELGQEIVVRVLGNNRRKFGAEQRPIMLVANQVSDPLVATAAEYQVTQIFTESLTHKNLGSRLTNLMIADASPNDVKKTMAVVFEARAGGDHKQALQALQKALQAHPTHLRLKCEAAETLMLLNEWDKAYALLQGIENVAPPNARAIHLLGRCLAKLGRFAEAVTVMEQASLLNPHDVERLVDIGNCLLQEDRTADAREKFEHALIIDPEFKPAKLGKAGTHLVDGDVNEALAILKDCAGNIELASLFNTSAILSARAGRHEAGMSLYHAGLKALQKDEKLSARLYFNMGVGYRRWGKPDRAMQCYEMAVKLDPSFDKVQKSLAALRVSRLDAAAAALPKMGGGGLTQEDDAGKASDPFDEDFLEENLYESKTIK